VSIEKKKPKRSAKPKRDQLPQNQVDATIQSDPAPKSDPPTPFDDPKPTAATYEWDRTPAETDKRLEDDRIRKTPFPLPAAKTLQFPEFCKYWNLLISNPVSKYARLYIRRWFPVLLPDEVEMPSGLTKEVYPSEKTFHPTDGPLTELKLLSFVGVGDYTIRLNDTRLPFIQATIVHCEKFCTQRDWDHYPPLMDVDRLDWDDAANQVYIKFAQSRGIFRRDDERREDKEAMAQASIVDTALSDARAERARTDRLNQEAIARLEKELKEAREAKPVVQPVRPTTDLEAMGGVIVSLVNAVKPTPDSSLSEYLKLEAKREETRHENEKAERDAARTAASAERARAEALQAEILADLRKKAEPGAVVAPRTDVEMLEEMVKKNTLLKQLTGRGGQEPEAETPSRVDKWLEAAPVIAPVIQAVIGGVFQTFQFGIQAWQTISYNNALARNGGEPKPPTTMEKPPEPGKPIQPQGPPPTPEQQAQAAHLQFMLARLEDAAEPIANAIDDGDSGALFAESIIKFKRRPAYDMIRALGQKSPGVYDFETFKANLGGLMQHPQAGPNTCKLWQKVAPLPTFGQFLKDFFDYDEIVARQSEEEDQK
jgi:hypothetical protein